MRASPAWCALAVAVQFASRPAGARELLAARPADHGPDGGNSSAPSGRGGVHGRPADGAALLLATRRVAEEPVAEEPVAAVRTPVNNIEYFPPNFEGLVLGCIDADFCK